MSTENTPPDVTPFLHLLGAANDSERATLNFSCSPQDMDLIVKCGARCFEIVSAAFAARGEALPHDAMLMAMNLAAVHCNGRPMHLLRLLMADNADFISDMGNIHHYLTPNTGKLPDSLRLIFEQKAN